MQIDHNANTALAASARNSGPLDLDSKGGVFHSMREIKPRENPPRSESPFQWKIAAVMLLVGFIVYALCWPNAPIWTLDTPSYMSLARDIQAGHLTRLHQRTPGYPLLLWLTGAVVTVNRPLFYIELLAHVGSITCIAWCLRTIGIRAKWIYLFATVALLPPFVAPSAYADTESVCGFAVSLAFAGLVGWISGGGYRALSVFILGAIYSAFVRPTYEALVPIAIVALILCYRLRLLTCQPKQLILSMGLAFFVCISGLISYASLNYSRFQYFDLSYMSAITATHKTTTFVEFLPERFGPLREILVRSRDALITKPYSDHSGQDYIYRALPELRRLYNNDNLTIMREIKAASLYLIIHKPFSYVADSMKLLATYWMPIEYPVITSDRSIWRLLSALIQWSIIGILFFQTLVVVGIAGFYWSGLWLGFQPPELDNKTRTFLAVYIVGMLVILYTVLISCFLGSGQAIYRVPTDMLIIAMPIIGFTIWRRMLSLFFISHLAHGAPNDL
jgi:hypothetical protein